MRHILEVTAVWCGVVLQAQYDASELITYREMVSQKITDELTQRSAHFGLILDDISIVSLSACVLACLWMALLLYDRVTTFLETWKCHEILHLQWAGKVGEFV